MIQVPPRDCTVVMTEERLNEVVKIVTDKVMKGQPSKAMLTLRRLLLAPQSGKSIRIAYEVAQIEIEARKKVRAAIRDYITSLRHVKIEQ